MTGEKAGAQHACDLLHTALFPPCARPNPPTLPPTLLRSCMYVGFAALFSLLASEFVAPTPSGWLARRELATALRGCGQLLWAACSIASGELGPGGRLAAASGKQSDQLSIDSGLLAEVWPLHMQSSALGTSCQVLDECGGMRDACCCAGSSWWVPLWALSAWCTASTASKRQHPYARLLPRRMPWPTLHRLAGRLTCTAHPPPALCHLLAAGCAGSLAAEVGRQFGRRHGCRARAKRSVCCSSSKNHQF